MSTQSEALRLADWMDKLDVRTPDRIANCISAAAELRRLATVEAERDRMREALEEARELAASWERIASHPDSGQDGSMLRYCAGEIRAALSNEGKTK